LEDIDEPELEFFAPKAGDPADYVRIRLASGERVTITNSCAANVLGYVKDGDYSRGNVESSRICMRPLADYLGVSIEECARQILAKSCEKVAPVITGFAEKYKIEADQISLVGCGGGASALLPFTAETMKLHYSIPEYAEVISSIGVALAMVRDGRTGRAQSHRCGYRGNQKRSQDPCHKEWSRTRFYRSADRD